MVKQKADKTLYKLISHPTRQAILQYIEKNESTTFSELSKIEEKPGALYYHLKLLKGLVDQDKNKKYYLTELGKYAVELLHKGLVFETPHERGEASLIHKFVWEYLSLNKIFDCLEGRQSILFSFLVGLVCFAFIGFVFYKSSIYLVLILLDIMVFNGITESFIYTGLNWIFLFVLLSLALYFPFKIKSKKSFLMLFLSLPVIFLPFGIYGLLVYFVYPLLPMPDLFLAFLFIISLWSMWILTLLIKTYTKLSLKNSVIITLYIAYIGMAILFFLKGP